MKAIGGYFELELAAGCEYHKNAIGLNTGRNSFEYILRVRKYSKVFLPHFICNVLLEPIKKLNVEVEYYSINEKLEPIFDYDKVINDCCFFYTNYFGLKDGFIRQLSKKCQNVIVDNAQAFFSSPIAGVDTFYSPRKFFGVTDGGYVYTDEECTEEFTFDASHTRFEHLLRRIDENAESGYTSYQLTEKELCNSPIQLMSALTKKILQSIDYLDVAKKRKENYTILNEELASINNFRVKADDDSVPLAYPLFTNDEGLRDTLHSNKVYTATYWSNVISEIPDNTIEYQYAKNLIHLPIDQRYGDSEMKKIAEIVKHG